MKASPSSCFEQNGIAMAMPCNAMSILQDRCDTSLSWIPIRSNAYQAHLRKQV